MNQKLKELALQAGGSHYPTVNPDQLELFAKLIIKECIKAVEEADCRDFVMTTYQHGFTQGVKGRCVRSIKGSFDEIVP